MSITPAQTVGPYFSIGLPWDDGPEVVPDGDVWIRGVILDGEREPIPDALVETWQADASGSYEAEDFRGFGRAPTNERGEYAIRTVKPGAVGDQAPHIAVALFARGLLHWVMTRIYFPEDAHEGDPVLSGLSEAERKTLIAVREEDGYRFDVRLQGPDETVLFDL
jgi:protocatechuate 3,4-dioxygenase, alpha subunit